MNEYLIKVGSSYVRNITFNYETRLVNGAEFTEDPSLALHTNYGTAISYLRGIDKLFAYGPKTEEARLVLASEALDFTDRAKVVEKAKRDMVVVLSALVARYRLKPSEELEVVKYHFERATHRNENS